MPENKDYSILFIKIFSAILILIVISSFFVIYTSFQSRQLFNQLQLLNYDIVEKENQKGKLLLEYSTWSSLPGLEKIARNELLMREPTTKDIIFTSFDSEYFEVYGK